MNTAQSDGELVTPWQMTDTANADRLVEQHAATLRYCADMGRWLAWDGTRWNICPDDAPAYRAARQAIESIKLGDSEALAKHKLRSLSETKLSAMIRLARRHLEMCVTADQLDANPYALNSPDGVIGLEAARITPCDPAQLHTKVTGCGVTNHDGKIDLNPEAPMWNQFLEDTFGAGEEGDDLIDYMQELAGAAAVGKVQNHVFPFLNGPGGNGKSVFTDVMLGVFGDYAEPCPANFLLAGCAQHPTEIAQLHGIRLAISSEINQGSSFDEAKVKLLTGGDKLAGRFMRQDFFKFTPTHSLWLVGNHRPEVPGGGTSFWRRLRLIPFNHQVPEGKVIDGLAEKLVDEEGPEILAWIAAGAKRVIRRGLRAAPQAVMEATGEYSADTKTGVARFLDEVCTVGGPDITDAKAAHESYQAWARHNSEPPLSIQKFGLDVRDAGVTGPPRAATGRRYRLKVHTEKLPDSKPSFFDANSALNTALRTN